MNAPCVYHPALPAVAPCCECGAALCKHCVQAVANQYACPKCASVVRDRLGVPAQSASGGRPPAQGYQSPPEYNAQPGYGGQPLPPRQGQAYAPPDGRIGYSPGSSHPTGNPEDVLNDESDKRKFLLGLGVSFAIGLVGSMGIMQMLYAAGYAGVYFYVLLGLAVGFSFCKIADVDGTDAIAAIASGILLFTMLIGHIMFVAEYAHHTNQPFFGAMGPALSTIGPFQWMVVGLSVVVCWVTVKYQQ